MLGLFVGICLQRATLRIIFILKMMIYVGTISSIPLYSIVAMILVMIVIIKTTTSLITHTTTYPMIASSLIRMPLLGASMTLILSSC